MAKRKSGLTKTTKETVYSDGQQWTVKYGELRRKKGRPQSTQHLFKVLGEKLPYSSLADIQKHVQKNGHSTEGVYVAHDSMGCPRYIGRGEVFSRLASHSKAHPELHYFSFYLVETKKHEREIETLLIRSASFLLEFNEKKRRVGIAHGNVRDYEAGTHFYERQRKRGKKNQI
jgi:hypothetical protein